MQKSILIFFLLLVPTVFARTNPKNHFTNPAFNNGNNPVWELGEKQVISWVTEMEVFNISFWQQSLMEDGASSQGNIYGKIHSIDNVNNFTWVVQLYDFDLSYSNLFFFWASPGDPNDFTSGFFNITESSSKSTTGATTNIITPTPTTLPTSTISPTQESSQEPSSVRVPSSGLETTGKIALGVGIGIGIPVLAALGALIWLKARQQRHNHSMATVPGATPDRWQQFQPGQLRSQQPKEMQGTDPILFRSELAS